MLYPTQHHSFLLHFTPSPSSLSAPRPLTLPPTSLSPQVVEMELGFGASAAAAEAVVKGGGDGAAEGDFFVDDLLDFSNASLMEDPEEEDLCVKESPAAVAVAADAAPAAATVAAVTPKDEFGGLSVPADDMESLEWLSQFVDDSFSEYSLTCPLTKLPAAAAKSRPSESEMVMVEVKPAGPTPVQTKARTKRARTGGRVWSLGSPSLTESSTSSTSSSSTTTSTCSPLSLLLYPPTVGNYYAQQTAESLGVKLPANKKSRKKADGGPAVVDGGAPQHSRRCTHCGVQKTPQWRSGPMGSKTLCNACGVRYKSGRLLPEYRPACSPTYSEQLHSNNHRKVMEMRRKKDGETAPGPLVHSF